MKNTWVSLVLFLCLLVGCKDAKQVARQDLRISSPYELLKTDPQKVHNDSDYKILHAAFEGLVIPDPESIKPLPGVAEHSSISPDGKIDEFFVRDNAKWSDETPVAAEDFVYAARRALSSKFACTAIDIFLPVRNAKAFFERKIRDFAVVGIHAVNSKTLIIELERSHPYFLMMLMHLSWSPLKDKVISTFVNSSRTLDLHSTFRIKVMSNGPFMYEERTPEVSVVLKKTTNIGTLRLFCQRQLRFFQSAIQQ
jgi:oligopeptide transport system substrate-binding protein